MTKSMVCLLFLKVIHFDMNMCNILVAEGSLQRGLAFHIKSEDTKFSGLPMRKSMMCVLSVAKVLFMVI
jgi:hypothetical protein